MADPLKISAPAFDTTIEDIVYPIGPQHEEFAQRHNMIRLQDIPNDEPVGRYRCLECWGPYIPVRPREKRRHFRHEADSQCMGEFFIRVDEEGQLEDVQAKIRICRWLGMNREIMVRGSLCSTQECPNRDRNRILRRRNEDTISMNYRYDGRRVDVGVANGDGIHFLIEVRNVAPATPHQHPWYEFSAAEVQAVNEQNRIRLRDLKPFVCGHCPQAEVGEFQVFPPACILEGQAEANQLPLLQQEVPVNEEGQGLGYLVGQMIGYALNRLWNYVSGRFNWN